MYSIAMSSKVWLYGYLALILNDGTKIAAPFSTDGPVEVCEDDGSALCSIDGEAERRESAGAGGEYFGVAADLVLPCELELEDGGVLC